MIFRGDKMLDLTYVVVFVILIIVNIIVKIVKLWKWDLLETENFEQQHLQYCHFHTLI